ncbi:MAG TPA: SCO family protein [Steroidobacteraceae bacterium]|nr:SCO family protein [Steroidobacteraceae bacterium]
MTGTGPKVHRALLLALALVLLLGDAAADAPALKAGVFTPARPAPDFTLLGSDGSELKLSRYRGKVVVVAFGFTSCPDVCPVTLATLAQARRKLGSEAGELQVLYITVDPDRDDAARMHSYLARFDATFLGGTGAADRLAAVREEYGITATKRQAGDSYLMAHSSFTYLIDRAGKLRALMPYGHTADDYVHDLRILLAGP